MGYKDILFPATVVLGSDQTTAAGAELTALTTTLTNPQNAGRALVTASASLKTPTVAGDVYTCRLYKDSTIIAETVLEVRATTARFPIHLSAAVAIADSGTQTLSFRVIRASGTGTITVDGAVANRTQISWLFVPNAQVS